MNSLFKYKLSFLFFFLSFVSIAQQSVVDDDYNCFSILIGRKATIDGSVMLAHNEDDGGERIVNWYRVPEQKKLKLTDSIVLKRGHKIPQTWETNAYLWFEIPELEFSDSYMNQYGLTITSNACKSREDKPDLVDGGIGYWLRRLMIERAKTAREAVEIAGMLINEIGYASSGRTYSIADSNEAWMLSVVQGKHWVAQRIPDNRVAIIPNYYTITEVDLDDRVNFLGSADLIDYAIERGWYHPDKDGAFNFRLAYSDSANLLSLGNKARHWAAINELSKDYYSIEDVFPFSFIPKKDVRLKDVFRVLRNHYIGTVLDLSKSNATGNPHKQKAMSICSDTNQYGFVAQLRSWLPSEIGDVLWFAPRRPCTETFIPIYSGISHFPDKFAVTDYKKALQTHFNKIENFTDYVNDHKYLDFGKKAYLNDMYFRDMFPKTNRKLSKLEKQLLDDQEEFEIEMLDLYMEDKDAVKEKLTKYSLKQLRAILKLAK